MRLVPLWDVEEDVLKPVVRGVLVFVRVVLVLPEDLEEAVESIFHVHIEYHRLLPY